MGVCKEYIADQSIFDNFSTIVDHFDYFHTLDVYKFHFLCWSFENELAKLKKININARSTCSSKLFKLSQANQSQNHAKSTTKIHPFNHKISVKRLLKSNTFHDTFIYVH